MLFVISNYDTLVMHVCYYIFKNSSFHAGHIMWFCCIYLPHLKSRSLNLLSDIKPYICSTTDLKSQCEGLICIMSNGSEYWLIPFCSYTRFFLNN